METKILFGENYGLFISTPLLKRKSKMTREIAKLQVTEAIERLSNESPALIRDYVNKQGNPVLVLSCGCKKEIDKVLFRNLKCRHGNYFIEILKE